MKRRKKLWIACAALVVVVALCALALLYRPAPPYRFLEGATLQEIRLNQDPIKTRHSTAKVCIVYRVEGTLSSAVSVAQNELTMRDGWTWSLSRADAEVWRGKPAEGVAFMNAAEAHPDKPPYVLAIVVRVATPLDRILLWRYNR